VSSPSGLGDLFGLDGKVALITGSTSGIGLAMAHAFGAAGAAVVVSSNEPDRCSMVAADLASNGVESLAVPVDVTEPAGLAALVDATNDHFGQIDVAVANAGVPGPMGSMVDVDDETWEAVMAINLRHPFRLANLVAPQMAERGTGSIIVTASIAGLRGNKTIGLYGLTKAALMQLVRNLAVEWGPRGVRANAIAPGLTSTSWTANILRDEEATAKRLGLTPLRRIATTQEIAGTAVFLAGPAAGSITGQTIVVDGGVTISDGS
jgi:NAD(P)-dependent dehydrogenase (short-subunit alcohol dehydrogenase family)